MRRLWFTACVALFACDMSEDNGPNRSSGPGADVEGAAVADASPTRLRRLTPTQYRNTMRDLLTLADADAAGLVLPLDAGELPSLLTVGKLDDMAAQLVRIGAHHKFVSCDLKGTGSVECATKFIVDLGSRAFRHPLTPEETDWLTSLYSGARIGLGFADSIDVVARVILQAPQLVYRQEDGEALMGLQPGILRVGPYELASRLSYFLWDSMPDDALMAAAGDKKLASTAGLREEATRMLAGPRARAKIVHLVTSWLELDGTASHVSIEEAVKAPTLYPLDSPALRGAVRREFEEFVGHVWDTGGSVSELLVSKDAFVNAPLAKFYGVTNGPADAATWSWVTLPPNRAGILTRAAFQLVYSNPDIPSPIRRGAAVWRELMCTTFPPPPPAAMDVKISGGEKGATGRPLSIREAVDAKTMRDPQCTGCHIRINPAGHVFGHYDALGQFKDQEKGTAADGTSYTLPIDATGELATSDVAGAVDGAVDFSARIASSRQMKDCVSKRYWTAAFGRDAAGSEQASFKVVQEKLTSSGSMRDAILSIIESPAFQYMRKGAP